MANDRNRMDGPPDDADRSQTDTGEERLRGGMNTGEDVRGVADEEDEEFEDDDMEEEEEEGSV